MQAIERRLYSRNSYFYYRYILPRNLKPLFPNKEIKVSLITKDLALARLYVVKLDIEVQSLINNVYQATDIKAAQLTT